MYFYLLNLNSIATGQRLLFSEGQFEKEAAFKALAAMTLTAGEGY